MDWDDVRCALAIGRRGSMAAAALALNLDQTTVSRRLKALERALDTPLFERHKGRLMPTTAGQVLMQRGARMEQEAAALQRLGADLHTVVQGVVRVTVIDTLAANFLVHHLAALRFQHPKLHVELATCSESLDLSRREADLAVRLARPERGDFVTQRVAGLSYGVYARCTGQPRSPDTDSGSDTASRSDSVRKSDTAPTHWLAYDHMLANVPEMRWLTERLQRDEGSEGPAAQIVMRCNNIDVLASAAADGVGCVALPDLVGARHPGLQRLSLDGPAVPTREIWLLTPRELRAVPRIDAVWRWLVQVFQANAQALNCPPHLPNRG